VEPSWPYAAPVSLCSHSRDGKAIMTSGPETSTYSALNGPRADEGFAANVRGQAQDYVARRKQDAVRVVADVAGAIRGAGAGFEDAPNVKAFFDSAAEGVEELSVDIGRRTVSELYDELDAAARRRPGMTLAVAAAAGFALYRLLAASGVRPIPRSRAMVPVDVLPVPDIDSPA
jgi:hypothetical protein